MTTTVRPHLWFGNNRAAEAARFYAEHIPGSSVERIVTAPAGVPGAAEGSDFIVEFVVGGWDLLTSEGGAPGPCGWCKDRFGVSWQVIPRRLEELSGDYTTPGNLRTMQAMLAMGKIDIAELERAYEGEGGTE